jgi:hypothetical protein
VPEFQTNTPSDVDTSTNRGDDYRVGWLRFCAHEVIQDFAAR